MRFNSFELRVATGAVDLVDVVIDGESLVDRWRRATGHARYLVRGADALWPGREAWLPDGGEGDASVLVDIDGVCECGGAVAHISVGSDTVAWSDFRDLGAGTAPAVGPFTFRRAAYEAAIAKAQAQLRR